MILSDSEIQSEITALAAELKAHRGDDFAALWESLRRTHLPFLPILLRHDLGRAHRLCVELLQSLGQTNIGFAYALENHLFILGGIETYLTGNPAPELRSRMDEIVTRRWFVANTRAFLHSDRAYTEGITARRQGGFIELNGSGSFLSLSNSADVILLILEAKEPMVLLFPAKGNDSISFGDLYFPRLMVASDTRPMTCQAATIPESLALRIPEDHLASEGSFNSAIMGWHLTLSVGQFLGGAATAAQATVEFAKSFRSFDNRPLTRVDGVLMELGQIGMRFGAAEALLRDYARLLTAAQAPGAPANPFPELLLRAQIANSFAMECTEEISRRCRRILGTRIFGAPFADLERITTELMVGPLIPRTNSLLERDIGFAMVSDRILPHGLRV